VTDGRTPGTVLVAHPSPDLYGSDRVMVETVAALRERGWRVVVTLPCPGPLVALVAEVGAEVVILDVPVLRKALLSPSGVIRLAAASLRSLPAMLRLLRRERPEVVYVNTVTVPLWLLAARLARRRVLAHVHEAEEAVPRPVRLALALPLFAADVVVANSLSTVRVLTGTMPRLGVRIRLLYNGVPGPAELAPTRERLVPPARLVLVGRLSPRKGSDIAIEAVADLRRAGYDVHLDLTGAVFAGYEWYEEQLREQVQRLGLTGVVRLLGFVPSVWDAYRDADIALVPSRVEPFGNVAVEAQLAGRPVVVARTQGLTEIVSDGRTGVVTTPDDPAAFAAGVATLLDDWPRAREMAATALAEAAQRFAPARYRAEIAELLDGRR
jgi:glycosyltransferase involved in cell wall biosynthesis